MNQFSFRLRAAGDRGAAVFLVVITILIVLFAGAFAVDLSATSKRGQELQNAADAAALAGVQAYRASMATRETEAVPDPAPTQLDKDKAIEAVNKILQTNGITGLTPVVTFPDGITNTEVRVKLVDASGGGRLLSGITGSDNGVEREATARFERCQASCVNDVIIPEPFRDINTQGDGDGYKPIAVGDRMFSINHNSGMQSDGVPRGNRQITCVDRFTGEQCWATAGRQMYPAAAIGNWVPDATPEMPHAAVYDEMIYWVSSTQSGTYLFCFNAAGTRNADTGIFEGVDSPCATPYQLNSNARGSLSDVVGSRVQHRGGGAFEWRGQIFAFTDDHRIHCIEPGLPLTACETYGAAGLETRLGQIGFPDNVPYDGNDGSSIDRIIDTRRGKVYATLHITNPAATHSQDPALPQAINNPTCATPLDNPIGDTVAIKNVYTNRWLVQNSPRSSSTSLVSDASSDQITARWYIEKAYPNDISDDTVFIRNAGSNKHLRTRQGNASYLTSSREGTYESTSLYREQWNLVSQGSGEFEVWSEGKTDNRLSNYWNGSENRPIEGTTSYGNGTDWDHWEFWPYECMKEDWEDCVSVAALLECQTPTNPTILAYETGTYLHCWDLVSAVPCVGHAATRIHDDPDSFSGRLFFHRTPRTPGLRNEVIDGVCSTGFTKRWRWMNMAQYTELKCFNHDDGLPNLQANAMGSFLTALRSTNDNSHGWGTWGDPHWNDHTNRMFYPTNRRDSKVLCWDFDTGWCGGVVGYSSVNGYIQDYGFYSEGNCIFGLGHNAYWWAFSASEFGDGGLSPECSGSSRTQTLSPCACAGNELKWGVMKFSISDNQFASFLLEILDEEGNRVYPPLSDDPTAPVTPPHDVLAEGGDTIELEEFLPDAELDPSLQVFIIVEPIPGVDPWADGVQKFNIELERTPRLTE